MHTCDIASTPITTDQDHPTRQSRFDRNQQIKAIDNQLFPFNMVNSKTFCPPFHLTPVRTYCPRKRHTLTFIQPMTVSDKFEGRGDSVAATQQPGEFRRCRPKESKLARIEQFDVRRVRTTMLPGIWHVNFSMCHVSLMT
jgi:hypothetical protein